MVQIQQLTGLGKQHWKKGLIVSAVIAVVLLTLLYQLGSLNGGASNAEVSQRTFAGDWHHILHNPLYAPLTVLQWIALTISPQHSQTMLRLPSVLFGLLTLVALGYVLRRWYGLRTALFSLALFASSAWFLHVSRSSATQIMYLWAIPSLLAAQIRWERANYSRLSTILLVGLLAVLLYVPGMFWIMVISFGLQAHQVSLAWKQLGKWPLRVGVIAGLIILLIPLLLAIAKDTALWLNWLGFPSHISPTNIPRNLAHSISFLVWHGPAMPDLWLDRLPILDFFSIIMLLFGSIFYARHVTAPRSRMLLGTFFVGTAFYAVHGPVGFSIIIPTIYIIIAAGIGYFLREWLQIFPRNPLARGIGYCFIGLLIALAGIYGLRSYFIAWPHAEVTKAAFHNHL